MLSSAHGGGGGVGQCRLRAAARGRRTKPRIAEPRATALFTGCGSRRRRAQPAQLAGRPAPARGDSPRAGQGGPKIMCSTSRLPRATASCARAKRFELVRMQAQLGSLRRGDARPGRGDVRLASRLAVRMPADRADALRTSSMATRFALRRRLSACNIRRRRRRWLALTDPRRSRRSRAPDAAQCRDRPPSSHRL